MTTSSARVIYEAAGRPPMAGESAGVCRACGCSDGVGLPFDVWVRDTFTNRDVLTATGSICCHACQFTMDARSAALQQKLRAEKPQRMMNYSHFVVDGEWLVLSKSNKAGMMRALRANPSVACIADSGQKHIIVRSRPGWWQFEELTLRPDVEALESIMRDVSALYSNGFTKAEIQTGVYSQKRVMNALELWKDVEPRLKRFYRGTALMDLAVFLVQKEGDSEDGATSENR